LSRSSSSLVHSLSTSLCCPSHLLPPSLSLYTSYPNLISLSPSLNLVQSLNQPPVLIAST
jgi:hypothetical protein